MSHDLSTGRPGIGYNTPPVLALRGAGGRPAPVEIGNGTPMKAKIFTLSEANAVLEQVIKPAVERLAARIAATESLQTEVEVAELVVASGASATNPDRGQLARLERRREQILAEMKEEVEAIHSTGGLLKDARSGLVDFFTILDGKLVFLCWRRGEDRIRYWHTVEDGFRGRRPLGARLPRSE